MRASSIVMSTSTDVRRLVVIPGPASLGDTHFDRGFLCVYSRLSKETSRVIDWFQLLEETINPSC